MKGAGVRLLSPALAREHHPPLQVTTFTSPQKNGSMGNHAHSIRHLIDTSTLKRGPPMTLHNHLFINTIPLPTHHPIHFLYSQNNLSQNRRHLAQNLSHAATFSPLRGKKIYDVWGILAVFKRMQRE